jgi:hypothetical protein
MTECVWERGDRERLHIHAADCFDTIEKLGLPLTEGQLLQAKLKVEIVGKSARPVVVTVRVPSRIEVSQARYEILLNEVLTSIGIRDARAAAPVSDLWTLHPWRHPIAAWRGCFGPTPIRWSGRASWRRSSWPPLRRLRIRGRSCPPG